MAEREAEAARQCSQQKGALSESPGQQYSRNRNMGALLGLQGINCFAMTFQKPERPRKNIRNNFFPEKEKKNREISRENVSVTLTTEAHCMAHPALCLAIVIPSGE